jgi:hypothetical protein
MPNAGARKDKGMPNESGIRPRVFAARAAPVADMVAAVAAAGPETQGGKTQHFEVFFANSLGANGPALADAVLARCEQDYAALQGFFGGITPGGLPFQVHIQPGTNGASHASCTATGLFCDAFTGTDRELVNSLVVAEADEVFMANQGKGWDCGGSNGEGLSRILADELHPNELSPPGTGVTFASAASWLDSDRPNWVDATEPTDQNFVSIGCATLFINYLRHQLGFSLPAIVQAGGATLAETYQRLTGRTDAFQPFADLLQRHFPVGSRSGLANDNPFPLASLPAAQATSRKDVPMGGWRVIPDVAADLWSQTVLDAGGPADLAAATAWQTARPHSALCLSQLGWESGFGTSALARTRRNPLGLRPRDGGVDFVSFASFPEAIAFWRDKIDDPAYAYAGTTDLESYIRVYSPDGDNRPGQEAQYVAQIRADLAQWGVGEGGNPMPTPPIIPAKPYIIVTAGHHMTGTGGNDADPSERSLTGFLANDYVEEFRRRGYAADYWQRDLDGDSLPDMTDGSLDTVALGCAAAFEGRDGSELLIDCHYNGPHDGLHVIIPDDAGLTTAYDGGTPPDDTWADNIFDRFLARAICDKMSGEFGMPLKETTEPGIMSERETGVGLDGFRLAMFAATAPVRDRCVRLVIEHGGFDDPLARQNNFTQLCAKAVADALDKVYGGAAKGMAAHTIPRQVPKWTGRDAAVDGKTWRAVNQVVRTTAGAPRLYDERPDSPRVGPDIATGTRLRVLWGTDGAPYLPNGADGRNTQYFVTQRGSTIPAVLCSPDQVDLADVPSEAR